MTSIANGESGLSVRTKLNAALAVTDAVSFATRAAFVSANTTTPGLGLTDGQVAVAGGYEYRRLASSSAIADLAGWVPNGETNIFHFGDPSLTNNQPALQAAINYELSAGKAASGVINIPEGLWRITSTVTCDVRGITGLPNTNRRRPPTLSGAGQGKTILSGTVASMTIYRVIGDNPLTTASYAYTEIARDLAFVGGGDDPRTVTGLSIEDMAFFTVRNVGGFNMLTPINMIGALSGTFENLRLRENTNGVVGTAGASHCNALTFVSSNIQTCTNRGISIQGGCSNLTLVGGSVEGCGTMGDLTTGGIYISGGGSQGEVVLATHGTYFEINKGGFDVGIDVTSGGSMVQSHTGSMFQRASNVSYVQNNIATTGVIKTVLNGVAFTKGNTYTADAGRPYISISALGNLITTGCRFEDAVEAPRIDQSTVFGGFVEGSLGASVTGDLPRNWSVSQISTGLFRVNHNFGSTDYAPVATITSGNARFVERIVRNSNSFDVRVLRTSDNVAIDDDFSFVVTKFGGSA
jgi:hypothetical protein